MANSQTFTLNIKAVADMKDVQTNIQNIQKALSQLKLPADTQNSFKKTFSELEKELDKYQKIMAGGIKTKNDASQLEKSGNNIIRLYDKVVETINSIDNSALKKAFEDMGGKEVEKLKQELEGLQATLKEQVSNKKASFFDFTKLKQDVAQFKLSIKDISGDALKAFNKLTNSTFNTFTKNLSEGNLQLAANNLKSMAESAAKVGDADLIKWVGDLQTAFSQFQKDGDISSLVERINEVKQSLSSAKTDAIKNLVQQFNEGKVNAEGLAQSIRKVTQADVDLGKAQAQTNKELDQIKSRIQYFLGLNNIINLTKRAIRGAVQTIKDLDKAMTETAVVTDFTVSDMWKQLPEYTKRANELGVTTQAAYEAATLYYQQGLNTEEVNALSVETLKMARIASLDAAEATDRMTNALRGFNMELNTANAQRVDDVYSELAANTASNVDEISTAMTKVASLAHSANMEFETTAAFLAQIIETTRESAETAGTALKTVVARFSEVKKLVDTNQLRGQDEEGQVVDVNRVSSALRTAGIDLNKYFLGEVGLDDIFMELASKWDSLTSVQQRYIATQAAGSRQQSRFIALMQDYARMQELVGKAYNAEGASARQFAKTQESLESKLNRLKNAWNEFLMGLTNNVMVKTFVDLLTNLLNLVNKLTSAFGDGVGSILKWTAALGGLAGLRTLFADGGLASKALGKIFSNTIIGTVFSNIAGIKPANTQIGTTGTEQSTKGINLVGGIGNIGKNLWGGAQKLGRRATFLPNAIGKATGGMASGLTSLGLTSGTAAGLTGIATALAAVTAAVTAALIIYKTWEKLSPEGQLKTAKKEAEKANKEAKEAQDDYKKLNSLQNIYKERTEEINKATNIQDRKVAVEERNEAILNAIKDDGTLAEYVITESIDNEIVLKVDEASLAAAAEKASEVAAKAATNARFKEATVDIKQGNVAKAQLERMYRRETNESPDFMSAEEIYKQIIQRDSISSQQKSKATEFYLEYTNAYGAAEQQAKTAYGQQLASLNIKDDLVNDLMPLLSEAYLQNQKQLNEKELKSIIDIDNISEIADAFSGALKSDKSLVNFNIAGDLKDILGIDLESTELNNSFRQLETTLGLANGTIKETIKQNIKLQKQRQEEVAKQATKTMIQGNMVRKDSYNVDTMAKYLSLQDFNDQQFVANLLQQIGNTDYGNLLINPIIDAMSSGLWENSDLQQWIENIDFTNPIEGAAALREGINSTVPSIRNLAQEILNTAGAQAQFSNSSQLSYFITSQSYDDLTDSLSKFIEENGKITSTNIEELAKSNTELNTILENNVTTAKGLAEILTHIEKGTIQIWDLSDGVIAATAAMDDLDGIVQSTIDDLNNFDGGFDENNVVDFIQKAYKTISENLDKGAIGNNQNRTFLEKIFGEDIFEFGDLPVDEWGRQYEQKVSELMTILEANQENMYSAWQDVLGTYETESGEQLQIFERDNEIFIEGARVTTDELISIIAKASGLGEQWARMMVTDYKNNSPDFAYQQGLADLDEGIKLWADSLGSINGTKIYTDTDIHTLATLFNVDEAAVRKAITGLGQSADELKEIDFNFDKKGKVSAEDYIRTFEQLGVQVRGFYKDATSGANLFQNTLVSDPNKVINFDQLKQAFNNAGLSQAFEGALNECVQAGDWFVAEIGGQLRTVEVKAGETASDAYNRVVQSVADQQLAENIGQQIVKALSGAENQEVNISFLVDKTEVDNFIAEDHTTTGTVNWVNSYEGLPSKELIPDITRKVNWTNTTPSTSTDASGGVVKSFASGSANISLSPGTALTGEEGPEIVWNKKKGYAYITGEDHPEFQDLKPGDRVFNAQETKKILGGAATGGQVPSYARGYGSAPKKTGSGGGSGSSGSGGKDKENEWKNDLDWLYNLMEDIVELERDQKALEEQYEDYLQDQSKTGQDLYKLLIKQLGNLYTQLQHQQFALEKREQEMREFMDVTNDQDQYLWYNWQDRTLEIDWDAIDQIKDEELYKHVKDLISEAEDIQDKIDDADDSIMDITNQIQELEHIWRDTYVDFEKRVLDALVKSYQKVIDNYSELNDTLNDSNSQILQSLQKEIDLQRQIRDNTKTEEEIADDEARLAYLRRDTSGGNDLDALQLEKDLNDQRESYTDTLIDQAIQRLQDDNDAAAQQRERQIEIMQAQLDYQSENGEFNAFIRQLMEDAISPDGQLLTDSELYTLLKTQENWDAMSDVNKQVWEEELTGTFKQVAAFLLKQNAEENGTFYTALTNAIEGVSSAIGSYSQAMVKIGTSYTGAGGPSGGGSNGPQKQSQSTTVSKELSWKDSGLTLQQYFKKYATGGLADTTGFAWLDGTPQEPEYVLNARQTDAFLKLADVLPSVMGNNSSSDVNNTFGATTFNLSVNVDKIASDYDVDHMCDLIKEKLYDSGSYRNVNSLSFIR